MDKCKAMQVGHALNINSGMGPAGSRVTPTETNIEKDLGVSTANDLNPAVQCEQAAAKTIRVVRMRPRYIEDLHVSGFRNVCPI